MRKKILTLVLLSVLLSLGSLGLLSYIYVKQSINHSFEEHSLMASMFARDIDNDLMSNVGRLMDIYISGSVNLEDGDMAPEKEALKTLYKYSMFTDGVFIVNRHGDVVATYPYKARDLVNALSVPAIGRSLYRGQVEVSDVYTDERTGRKYIYALAPISASDGAVIGAVGGRLDPTDHMFSQFLRMAGEGTETVIELVDSRGSVIASNHLDRVLTMSDHNMFMEDLIKDGKPVIVKCHRCHYKVMDGSTERSSDILAFAPLKSAPWGVAVRMPEAIAFGPAKSLVKASLAIGFVLVMFAAFMSDWLSRRIVAPLRSLTESTKEIARGHLEAPVDIVAEDEVGELAGSLEVMRTKLDMLVRESMQYSSILEDEVQERTQELTLRKKQLASLLDTLITTQEDERKRIARELHDDTAQTIAALGMSIDVAEYALANGKLEPAMLSELREKVSLLLDNIGSIIKNLRPPVLDDLGLESAVAWFMEKHLKVRGIGHYVDIDEDLAASLDKKSELRIFRIIQEAVINAARHSEAEHVSVTIRRNRQDVDVEIVDDGVGFEYSPASGQHVGARGSGFGLLGIRERVDQMHGELEVVSAPGQGTAIYITLPVAKVIKEMAGAENQNPDS